MPSQFTDTVSKDVQLALQGAHFMMLRYETEYTPCTGITAVSKQERRHFQHGVMIAPWCSLMPEAVEAIAKGKVRPAGSFGNGGREYTLYITADNFAPIIYIGTDDHFLGTETPYSTPGLKMDSLVFGLGVSALLAPYSSTNQFIWGADWESVPALLNLWTKHHIALTLHNTFDECLQPETEYFQNEYPALRERRDSPENGFKTALEVGMSISDVVTTVNRGFAHGMRTEPIQQAIMASHLKPYLHRVVGINNATFSMPETSVTDLLALFRNDFPAGVAQLRFTKALALSQLPEDVARKSRGKTIVVTMGRRGSQKQHDVFVESVRDILTEDPLFPILAFFATTPGDAGGVSRLDRMKALQEKFPENVIVTDKRLAYYRELMAAADYNCMPSLYEPHGGAYEGIVIPIARAVDGLAEQICALRPQGIAVAFNNLWHSAGEQPTGFLFREDHTASVPDLAALLEQSPSPHNQTFRMMVDALKAVLTQAVQIRQEEFDQYAALVMATIEKQLGQSWLINLGGMLALIEEARHVRTL